MTFFIFAKGAAHRLCLKGDADALGSNPTAPVVLAVPFLYSWLARRSTVLLMSTNVRFSHTF